MNSNDNPYRAPNQAAPPSVTRTTASAPSWIFVLMAFLLGCLGLMFLIAAGQGNALVRVVIGSGCMAGAGSLIYLARMRPVTHTHIHQMQVDLPGQIQMKNYECQSCGATLDSGAVKVVAGAIQVDCPYCGTSYQMEESAKW